ncbi:hypothetical protein Xoosp13_152 [Xanthomonas phage Xoo-sp13]|nr:hypothetical protein Xoosp13_152 [Xanthomonas phage Xoo-sp13]
MSTSIRNTNVLSLMTINTSEPPLLMFKSVTASTILGCREQAKETYFNP